MMCLKPNTLLQGGKYKIVRFLSAGGFGCTYEAIHTGFNERVAIKEFFVKDFCNRDEKTAHVTVGTSSRQPLVKKLQKKFVEEARAIRRLKHPNIVQVSDVFEENGTAYYVMDYIDGYSLHEIVKRNGALSEQKAVKYILQVAEALKYVHTQNRLHLDIKPGNIMIDEHDNAILIDFGASKQYDEEAGENTSTLIGKTPGYASPEQMGNDVVTFTSSTDIYALGATLYKLLTGVTPISATLLISGEKLTPISSSISKNIRIAVYSAMTLIRAERTQTVDEFINSISADRRGIKGLLCSLFKKKPIRSTQSVKNAPHVDAPRETTASVIASSSRKNNHKRKVASLGYREAAEQGYAVAQCNIGDRYYFGKGVVQNYNEAVRWYKKAAEQGLARAQSNIGVCYHNGQGVPQDYEEAVRWHKKAAEQGNADAQNSLGGCYYFGKGVVQNYNEAVRWYKKAAEQGNANAQNNLGRCYYYGKGVQKNNDKAVLLFNKAAEQDHTIAQKMLGICYKCGDGVPQNFEEAARWFEKAANQGDAKAQIYLKQCNEQKKAN